MSLDVTLKSIPKEMKCICSHCDNEHIIFDSERYYSANITHNLGKMAVAANIYKELWRPEEIDIKYAHQLVGPLMKGLKELKAFPDKYKQYDSPNGWGLYIHFVPFVEKYLEACIEYPDALIEVSR